MMKKSANQDGKSPAKLIDERIEDLDDWRGTTLAKLRGLIKQADPKVVEEVKWVKPSNPGGVGEDRVRRSLQRASDLTKARTGEQGVEDGLQQLRTLKPIGGSESLLAEASPAVPTAEPLDTPGRAAAEEETIAHPPPTFG